MKKKQRNPDQDLFGTASQPAAKTLFNQGYAGNYLYSNIQ